jgi:hypothetical protein
MSLIAFWAGSNVNTRESAPFSVGYDGYLSASNVNITGNITATSGTVGGFTIPVSDPYRLESTTSQLDTGIKKITLDSTLESIGILSRINIIETSYQSRPDDFFGDFSIDSAGLGFTLYNPQTITSVVVSGTAPNKTIVYTVTDSTYINPGDSVTISGLSGTVESLNTMDVVISSKTLTTMTVTNYNTSIANGTYSDQFGTIGALKTPYLIADSTYFTDTGNVQGYIFTAITSDVGLEYGSDGGPNIILGKTRNGDVGLSSVSAIDGSPDVMYIQPGGGETNFGGIVTAPSQPAVYAFSTVARSVADNGVLTFQNAVVNNGGYYNAGTSTFTAPVAGKYLVMAKILTNNDSGASDCRIAINGVKQEAYAGYSVNAGVLSTHKQGHVYGIVNLAAYDTIQIRATGTVSFYGAGAGHASLNIHLIG